jgi:phosphoglycerate dehydrogenase-like enzyme
VSALPRIAVLDDSQDIAPASADWAQLKGRAEVIVFKHAFANDADAARQLAGFTVIVPMRERTPLPGSLIRQLPALRMVAMTGHRNPSLDIAACTAAGVLVCNTGLDSAAATSELALALILTCARGLPQADAAMRKGGWHEGLAMGFALSGRRLGLVGLGKLGARVAGFGRALGMEVVAWSQNLTAADAAAKGARRVEKAELFATADVVSVHLVLSDRTRGIIGAPDLAAMRDGSVLVNTARGPIIDEAALLAEARTGRLRIGLDVYGQEPLPADHPLRTSRAVTLAPHLGYSTEATFRQMYGESLENIVAFLDGKPVRVLNPEAVKA